MCRSVGRRGGAAAAGGPLGQGGGSAPSVPGPSSPSSGGCAPAHAARASLRARWSPRARPPPRPPPCAAEGRAGRRWARSFVRSFGARPSVSSFFLGRPQADPKETRRRTTAAAARGGVRVCERASARQSNVSVRRRGPDQVKLICLFCSSRSSFSSYVSHLLFCFFAVVLPPALLCLGSPRLLARQQQLGRASRPLAVLVPCSGAGPLPPLPFHASLQFVFLRPCHGHLFFCSCPFSFPGGLRPRRHTPTHRSSASSSSTGAVAGRFSWVAWVGV